MGYTIQEDPAFLMPELQYQAGDILPDPSNNLLMKGSRLTLLISPLSTAHHTFVLQSKRWKSKKLK